MDIPQVGEIITTQRNKRSGVVKEVVANKTGSYRVRYQAYNISTGQVEENWTTYIPKERGNS